MRILTLAARNLTRNLRRTLLTGAAITFGLALMMFTINLQNGQYQEMLKRGVSSLAGHVVIEHSDYSDEAEAGMVVPGAAALSAKIHALSPDAVVAPRIQMGGLLTSPANAVGVGLRGFDPDAEKQLSELDDQIVDGEWLKGDDERGILIGVALADRLSVGVGDKVVFMGQGTTEDVESRLFRVRGLFRTGGAELDSFVAFSTLTPAQILNGTPDSVHQLTLHLPDARESGALRDAVRPLVDEGFDVLTWDEALPDLVALIRMDRTASDIMMSVIGLIVAMGVLNTVLMSVLERVREFGVLLSIGMRPRQVASVVLAEGFVLGVCATLSGVLVGALISYPLVQIGLDYSSFLGETYEAEGIVMSSLMRGAWDPARMAQYAIISVIVTVGAAVYPAWHITRLSPVDAVRQA